MSCPRSNPTLAPPSIVVPKITSKTCCGSNTLQQNFASTLMGKKITELFDSCCEAHDDDYCSPSKRIPRVQADLKFYNCMISKCDTAAKKDSAFPLTYCHGLAWSFHQSVHWAGFAAYNKCDPNKKSTATPETTSEAASASAH